MVKTEIYECSDEKEIIGYLRSKAGLQRVDLRKRYGRDGVASALNITLEEVSFLEGKGILRFEGFEVSRESFAPFYRRVYDLEGKISNGASNSGRKKNVVHKKTLPDTTRIPDGAETSIDLYFDDIAEYNPLPSEREIELAKKFKEGDLEARNELIRANLRFVVRVAKEYPTNKGVSLQDLISAGNYGLITAAERFDGTRGFKFISYAVWWIRQAMLQTLAEHSDSVRKPLNQVSRISKMRKAARELTDKIGSVDPNDMVSELSDVMELKEEQVEETIKISRGESSLDAPVYDDETGDYYNVTSDDNQESPDEAVSMGSNKNAVSRQLSCLNERELRVIKLYFGLGGYEPMTLEKIGEEFGLTRERVRQLKETALGKMRHPSRIGLFREIRESM